MKIIQNAVYAPDQHEYLSSVNRHDYIAFSSQGDDYFIDGGREYLRRSFNSDIDLGFVDYTLTEDSTIMEIYNKLLWGTYGKTGVEPLKWIPVRLLETDHLQSILLTQRQIHPLVYATIMYTLNQRKNPNSQVL